MSKQGSKQVKAYLEGATAEAQLAVANGVAGGVAHDREQPRVVTAMIRDLANRHIEFTNDVVGEGRRGGAPEQECVLHDDIVRIGGRLHLYKVEDGWPVVARGGGLELDAGADAIPAETPRGREMSANRPNGVNGCERNAGVRTVSIATARSSRWT